MSKYIEKVKSYINIFAKIFYPPSFYAEAAQELEQVY